MTTSFEEKLAYIQTMKDEHDKLWRKAEPLYRSMEVKRTQILDLRNKIEAAEGDDYDGVHILFCGTFDGE